MVSELLPSGLLVIILIGRHNNKQMVCDQFISKWKVTKDAVAGKGKNTKDGNKRVR